MSTTCELSENINSSKWNQFYMDSYNVFLLFSLHYAKFSDRFHCIYKMYNNASLFQQAVVGLLLFSEHLSLRWWFGSVLILVGLVLINRGNLKDEAKRDLDKNK